MLRCPCWLAASPSIAPPSLGCSKPTILLSALFHHLLPLTPALQPARWQPLPAARHSLPAELVGWLLWSEPLPSAQGGCGRKNFKCSHPHSLQLPPHQLPSTHTRAGRGLGNSPCPAPCTLSCPAYRHWTWPRTQRAACRPDTGTVRVILSSVAQNTRGRLGSVADVGHASAEREKTFETPRWDRNHVGL